MAVALEAEAWLLSEVHRASLETRCDFQVRFEDGHGAMMPHVGSMRKLGLLLVVDARRLAMDRQSQAAAERLAAAFRFARHLSSDHILIVSLPARDVGNMAARESQWLLDATEDDSEVARIIRTGLDRLPPEDPYNFKAALRTERDIMVQVGEGPDAALRFMHAFVPDAEVKSAEQADWIWKAMGGGEFAEDVDRCSRAYEQVFSAWDAPDPQSALEDIGARVADGDHGVVAAILMPNFGRIQSTDAAARARLEALRARVKGD